MLYLTLAVQLRVLDRPWAYNGDQVVHLEDGEHIFGVFPVLSLTLIVFVSISAGVALLSLILNLLYCLHTCQLTSLFDEHVSDVVRADDRIFPSAFWLRHIED